MIDINNIYKTKFQSKLHYYYKQHTINCCCLKRIDIFLYNFGDKSLGSDGGMFISTITYRKLNDFSENFMKFTRKYLDND
jgi:hypothetical protein